MLSTILEQKSSAYQKAGFKIKPRQEKLAAVYQNSPAQATVLDYAVTDSTVCPADDAVHSFVKIDKNHKAGQHISVHRAVGGNSDAPTPGDLLCGAIASCLDTAIRVIANRYGLKLKRLKVEVSGKVDVRGTLRLHRDVPVRFTGFDVLVHVEMQSKLQNAWINRLIRGAKQSCIVLQTLNPECDIKVKRVNV